MTGVQTCALPICRRYSPANIVLAGAGRIEFERLVRQAETLCGAWERVAASRDTGRAAPCAGFHVLSKETATQQYVLQIAPGPASEDEDRHAAKLLATVLGDDSGSRLYWEIVDPGLAEHVSLSHGEHQGTGMMMTYMSCDPEHVQGNLQRIFDIYRTAEAKGITSVELEQAKNKIRSRIVLSSERPRGRLFAVGNDWVYRQQYQSVAEELAVIARITVDDVMAVLTKYPLSRTTTVTIGPLEKVAAPA